MYTCSLPVLWVYAIVYPVIGSCFILFYSFALDMDLIYEDSLEYSKVNLILGGILNFSLVIWGGIF